jgi:hypothetical protein
MMIGMLVAGGLCLVAGLAAIGFGIPVNEFSFGNTLILAGAIFACTGLIILALLVVVREVKGVRLGSGSDWKGSALQPPGTAALPRPASVQAEGTKADPDHGGGEHGGGGAHPPTPWLEEAASRDRPRQEPPPVEEPPATKPRRNLMFSSSSRRERERAQARAADPAVAAAAPASEIAEVAPATFDDAWPKSERARSSDVPPQRRDPRSPPPSEAPSARPPVVEEAPPVTVLKSGVVDGMAYSLYSDGSIEAQMPEGMMRFASIDELRAHLDQRP